MEYLNIFFQALIANNIVLTLFLGICSFIGVSKSISSAKGMSLALVVVIIISSLSCWGIYQLLVLIDAVYLMTVVFIVIIATFVQVLEMIMKKYFTSLYKSLGIYLPLITTNCIVLFVTREIVDMSFLKMLVYMLGTSLGYCLVIIPFSAIREKISNGKNTYVTTALALLTTSVMALAFYGLSW